MDNFVKVAKVDDVSDGDVMLVEVDGEDVLLANVDGELYAIGDECTHQGGSLSNGWIEDGQVECPVHGSMFDLRTGENTGPPQAEPVLSYPVRIDEDDVFVGPAL